MSTKKDKNINIDTKDNHEEPLFSIHEIEIDGFPKYLSNLEQLGCVGENEGVCNLKTAPPEKCENKVVENSVSRDGVEYVQGCDSSDEEKSNNEKCVDDLDRPIEEDKCNKKRNIMVAMLTTASLGFVGVKAYDFYSDIKAEEMRLSELDKSNIDLKLVINTVDECGENKYQLNWKEIVSILGVMTSNHTENITENQIKDVSSLFIDKNKDTLKDLRAVVNSMGINDKEKQRVFDYMEDLTEFGYTPEKLMSTSSQMEFINSIKKGAIESHEKTGILPSITIAQAILESNWGQSSLSIESNNLFGIKADSSWSGESVIFETKEYHDVMINDKFRKYPSVNDSIVDHSEFLTKNPRYTEGGVFNAKTYKTQALALQESGYSTAQDEFGNKTYALMLEQLIRQYNLQLLDWEVLNSFNT